MPVLGEQVVFSFIVPINLPQHQQISHNTNKSPTTSPASSLLLRNIHSPVQALVGPPEPQCDQSLHLADRLGNALPEVQDGSETGE